VLGRVFLSILILFCLAGCRGSILRPTWCFGRDDPHRQPARPRASYLAVKGNTIVAVGDSEKEAGKYIGPDTRVIDLRGKFVVPGIIDAMSISTARAR